MEKGGGGSLRVLSDQPPLPLDCAAITFCCTFIYVTVRNGDKQETKVTINKIMAITERERLKLTVALLPYQNKQVLWAKMALLKIAFLV